MRLPTNTEYVAAVQNPAIAFRHEPELAVATIETRMGLPKAYSGGFTVTFHAVGEREWAVRCFTRPVASVVERYAAISRFSRATTDPLFARAELVRGGIFAAGGRHDLIKMEWLRGRTLDAYVRDRLRDGAALRALAGRVVAMGRTLEALGMSHGDLQHGNVLVTDAGELRLVDYDDMYLPELAGLNATSGIGHENYQHPGRTGRDFDATTDRFSLASLTVGLLALACEPDLFERFGGGDECLLFRRGDYADPASSAVFGAVAKLPEMAPWIAKLAACCARRYAEVPAIGAFVDGAFAFGGYRHVAKKAPPPRPRLARPVRPPARPRAAFAPIATGIASPVASAPRSVRSRAASSRVGLRSLAGAFAVAVLAGVVLAVVYVRVATHPARVAHLRARVVPAPVSRHRPPAVAAPAVALPAAPPERAESLAAPPVAAAPRVTHADLLNAAAEVTARPATAAAGRSAADALTAAGSGP